MDIETLLMYLLDIIKTNEHVESVSRIDGENAIGLETDDGDEYFITIERA